jgi:hypothetical protein
VKLNFTIFVKSKKKKVKKKKPMNVFERRKTVEKQHNPKKPTYRLCALVEQTDLIPGAM